jgi:cysteate synthase
MKTDQVELEGESDMHLKYRLECLACGASFCDDGYRLECNSCQTSALLAVRYKATSFEVCDQDQGLFRYRKWLPVQRNFGGVGVTAVYQSPRLSEVTGLNNLWIAFNGYWPEKGALLRSGTFKELEAYCVLGRIPTSNERTLVVASAGNTGAAFARVCSYYNVPCVIIIPESAMPYMRFEVPISPCVTVVTVTGGGDYSDAITAAETIGKLQGFALEGGARNVARRAGLGSIILKSFETIGRMPDHYFQAIGSGTGAIAVHEAAKLLMPVAGSPPRMWLSQNLPFAPIESAWASGGRRWPKFNEKVAKQQIRRIAAGVLANRYPPYSIKGGLFDTLTEAGGVVVAIDNTSALHACELFEKLEGIDISPAAGVALASLLDAAKKELISSDSTVLINITGGGQQKFARDHKLTQYPINTTLGRRDIVDPKRISHLLSPAPFSRASQALRTP